ncbi:MAG: ATP-binding cassette domain-containing protein [Candidatus Electrothrix sp. AUS4]|nr:ATP-binding cassette domain-containing protein [Candidatus Electrothrix sp. AUS4]
MGGYGQDERNFFIPQVIQSSMMDCGPASLKALLAGFGIHVSYGRLREACQTDVDGTSIDTMEDLAIRLGLDAMQILVPADHVFLPEADALPALVVVLLPNGLTHFIIIWRVHGSWVQIMDPGTGRHWVRREKLQKQLYVHQHLFDVEDWLGWAASPDFCDALLARLLVLCNDAAWAEEFLQSALSAEHWERLAALDAATRMVYSLVQAGGIVQGNEAGKLIEQCICQAETIPDSYWSVRIAPHDDAKVIVKGAVLIHAAGLLEQSEEFVEEDEGGEREQAGEEEQADPSVALRSSLQERAPRPELHIFRALAEDGLLAPFLLLLAVLPAGCGRALESVILRGLVEITQQAELLAQQTTAFVWTIFFLFSLLVLRWALSMVSMRLGRHLEIRLRRRFLEKIPHLEDRYFHSRLTSDMIQRAYELRLLRTLPSLGMNFIRNLSQMVFITLGLIILYPGGTLLILLSTFAIISFSLLSQPLMQEQDMCFRTHTGSLSRFYLDALQGLLPIRSHGAAPALRSEHERLLVDWVRAGKEFFLTYERMTLLGLMLGTAITLRLLFSYLSSGGDSSGTLILLYWMLLLPQLGRSLSELAQQYPSLRNRLLRLLEPLNAPDESYDWYLGQQDEQDEDDVSDVGKAAREEQKEGVSVQFQNVSVVVSGHTILHGLGAELQPGEQVAVVGASGAGKSTLVGLLLGWHRPMPGGSVRVDRKLLQGAHLQQVRRDLVWVDPEVQLWNRSLQDNLKYGNDSDGAILPQVLDQAELLEVLARLPQGMQTQLGENGGFLSGGEGQRVRLGRGLNRAAPRLVILDEPFRGLTRNQRRNLLVKVRKYWQGCTLIFISHDVGDTLEFKRVWLIQDGCLLEDDNPKNLAATEGSAYAQLLAQEQSVRQLIWGSADWIKLRLEKGKLFRAGQKQGS